MMNKVDIVTEIFAVWDPMELIEITQDENEYMTESKIIAQYIDNNNPDVDNLGVYIQKVFAEYFNDEVIDIETTKLVADCIIKNLEEE